MKINLILFLKNKKNDLSIKYQSTIWKKLNGLFLYSTHVYSFGFHFLGVKVVFLDFLTHLYPLQKQEEKLMRLYFDGIEDHVKRPLGVIHFASSPNIPDCFIGYKLPLSHNQEKSSNRYSLEYRARKSKYYLRS